MAFAIPTAKTHAIRKDIRHIEHIENWEITHHFWLFNILSKVKP
jgi:hypothetical protein